MSQLPINPLASSVVGSQLASEAQTDRLRRRRGQKETPGRVEAGVDHVVELTEAVAKVGDALSEKNVGKTPRTRNRGKRGIWTLPGETSAAFMARFKAGDV